MANSKRKNTVLIIGGHDPCGGAGIQADIETVIAHDCNPVSVITALTAQNTQGVKSIIPQTPAAFLEQLELVLSDISIDACKIGLLPSVELIKVLSPKLSDWGFPIVADPVLRSGSGKDMVDTETKSILLGKIIARCTLATPNSEEARCLTGKDKLSDAAINLLDAGAKHILITGTHEAGAEVNNTLYIDNNDSVVLSWPRLANEFHGSGCTLASAIAANLANGMDIRHANQHAQHYTWHSLKHANKLGKGQWHPNRFYIQNAD